LSCSAWPPRKQTCKSLQVPFDPVPQTQCPTESTGISSAAAERPSTTVIKPPPPPSHYLIYKRYVSSPGERKFLKPSKINQKSASCHWQEAAPISGLRVVLIATIRPQSREECPRSPPHSLNASQENPTPSRLEAESSVPVVAQQLPV
jgi:hypothetical protein